MTLAPAAGSLARISRESLALVHPFADSGRMDALLAPLADLPAPARA